MLSAVLLFQKQRGWWETIKKKARTLLVPYLFWLSLWILVYGVMMKTWPDNWLGAYGIGQKYPFYQPLWFLRDLMLVTLFFPVIKWCADKWPKIILGVGLLLALMPIQDLPCQTATAWFLIGAAIVRMDWKLKLVDKIPLPGLGVASVGIVALAEIFSNLVIIKNLSVLVIMLFVMRLSKYIYDSHKLMKFFAHLMPYVFVIYVAHGVFLNSMIKIATKISMAPVWLFAMYWILPLIAIGISVIMGMVLKRFMPKFYAIITGGR